MSFCCGEWCAGLQPFLQTMHLPDGRIACSAVLHHGRLTCLCLCPLAYTEGHIEQSLCNSSHVAMQRGSLHWATVTLSSSCAAQHNGCSQAWSMRWPSVCAIRHPRCVDEPWPAWGSCYSTLHLSRFCLIAALSALDCCPDAGLNCNCVHALCNARCAA